MSSPENQSFETPPQPEELTELQKAELRRDRMRELLIKDGQDPDTSNMFHFALGEVSALQRLAIAEAVERTVEHFNPEPNIDN